MQPDEIVTSLIPHRPPFLWVDRIIDFRQGQIITEKTIPADLDVFTGHYPGQPIMPGVLLCEALFQTGALLMAKMQESDDGPHSVTVPVLARITGARFKRSVYPGDTMVMEVKLNETLASACFFTGKLRVQGKLAVQVDFSCTLQLARP
jgi:3-hydroxyacyl-[acyl-carrier-protein] dehydratase